MSIILCIGEISMSYYPLLGDDPWTEHARWFPFCKFVMKIKGIQFIEEIQQRYMYETVSV